jgi:hypothetical protein
VPYLLLQGNSVKITVTATNSYGTSGVSAEGVGAVIKLVPDAPLLLKKDITSNEYLIKLTWSDGASDGGSSIIDYIVYYDQGIGNFIELATGVLVKEITTSSVTLIPGQSYAFKVKARNSVGLSQESEIIEIPAAVAPTQPNAPTTRVQGSDVVIEWTVPADGNSPITSY